MYDALDVHGGSSGIPVWMTDPRWKDLQISERPRVLVENLRELRALLDRVLMSSNLDERLTGGSQYEHEQTSSAAATTKAAPAASETRKSKRVSAAAGGTTADGSTAA